MRERIVLAERLKKIWISHCEMAPSLEYVVAARSHPPTKAGANGW